MYASRRRVVVAALVSGVALFAAAGAGADHGGRGNEGDDNGGGAFRAQLLANLASDPAIHGVAAAPADWRLRSGSVRLQRKSGDLQLRLEVKRLVLASTGTTGTVTTITASLFCGGTRADETRSARLSSRGNARIRDEVTAPARCLAPEVVVHPNGTDSLFIAASGVAS